MALWLAKNGYNYLTDELVNIPLDSTTIEPFTRPINIKARASSLLRKEFNIHRDDQGVLDTGKVSMIPHRHLNADHVRTTPQLRLILFPNIVIDGEQRMNRLSKAETTLKLVECLVNGRNLANHGFDQLARLAKNIPAYEVYYRGFRRLPVLLSEVLPGSN